MAGSAISRALPRLATTQQLTPAAQSLTCSIRRPLKPGSPKHQPTVVVLAAAKVGGIYANSSYPADFLLENLKIQTNVIETAWRSGVRRCCFSG